MNIQKNTYKIISCAKRDKFFVQEFIEQNLINEVKFNSYHAARNFLFDKIIKMTEDERCTEALEVLQEFNVSFDLDKINA